MEQHRAKVMVERKKIPAFAKARTGSSAKIKRRRTKTVKIGSVNIGSRFPVSIQSMTKTDTLNVSATVNQIKKLKGIGCEIVRVAVKDRARCCLYRRRRQKHRCGRGGA